MLILYYVSDNSNTWSFVDLILQCFPHATPPLSPAPSWHIYYGVFY